MEGLDAEEGVKLAKFLAKKRGGTIGMYFLGGSEDAEDIFQKRRAVVCALLSGVAKTQTYFVKWSITTRRYFIPE